jgi:hypothetical protein
MIPFLKDRHEGGISAPVEVTIKRTHDEDPDFGMLDAIVEDMIEAIHSKNKKLLKGALEALVEHMQEQDEIQDAEEMQ